jgi:hypothetical protein
VGIWPGDWQRRQGPRYHSPRPHQVPKPHLGCSLAISTFCQVRGRSKADIPEFLSPSPRAIGPHVLEGGLLMSGCMVSSWKTDRAWRVLEQQWPPCHVPLLLSSRRWTGDLTDGALVTLQISMRGSRCAHHGPQAQPGTCC